MRIAFRAYADDYTVEGSIELPDGRLADLLAAVDEIAVEELVVRALDDGRSHGVASAAIPREELCVVAATGPRGRPDRRVRTRAYAMRAEAGPYVIVGYFNGLLTADPLVTALRREVIALSPARVEYAVAGQHVEENHDGLLMIRTKLALFEPASDQDVGLAKSPDPPGRVDSQAKDFTGDVHRES